MLLVAAAIAMAASLGTLAVLLASFDRTFVGMLLVLTAYPLLVHQVLNLKSWQTLTRETAPDMASDARDRVAALTKAYFRVELGCVALAGVLGTGLVPAVRAAFGWPERWEPLLYLFAATVFLNFSSFSFAVFRLLRASRVQALCTALLPVGQLALTGMFWGLGLPAEHLVGYWLALIALSYLVTLICALALLRQRALGHWWRARPPKGNQALRSSLWINAATSLDAVVKQLDLLLVSALISVDAVPGYRLLKQSGAALFRFADVIAQTSYSRLLALLARDDQEGALRLTRAGTLSCAAVGLAMALVLGATAGWWLPLFGPQSLGLREPLTVYLLVVALAVAGTVLHQVVYALGYTRLPVLSTAIAVAAFLIAVVVLSPFWGLWAFVAGFAIYHLLALTAKVLLLAYHQRQRARR